jgi:hypothetical protein
MTAEAAPDTPTASAKSQMYRPRPTAHHNALELPSTLGARGATTPILLDSSPAAVRIRTKNSPSR